MDPERSASGNDAGEEMDVSGMNSLRATTRWIVMMLVVLLCALPGMAQAVVERSDVQGQLEDLQSVEMVASVGCIRVCRLPSCRDH